MKSKTIFFSFIVFVLINMTFSLAQVDTGAEEAEITLCDPLEENCNIESTFEGGFEIFEVKEAGSYITIGENSYFNLDESSSFKVDEKGKISEAFIIASDESSYTFDEKSYKLSKGQSLEFKNGKTEIKGYGLEGEIFEFEFSQKEGTPLVIKSEGSVFVSSDEKGNSIFSGNFLLGENAVEGFEAEEGKVTVSNLGKIIQIGENTNAKIEGISHTVKNPLNIYYDSSFNPKNYEGENYFNYDSDNILLGGEGFSFELLENNFLYPEMEFEREISGSDIIKRGDFIIEPMGGILRISQQDSKFFIESDGDFNLKNGKAMFFNRENILFSSLSKENNGFSYDFILNEDYSFENSKLIYNGKTSVDFNSNPWENVLRNAKNFNREKRDALGIALTEEWKARPRTYTGFVNDEREEDFVQWIYDAANTANMNKYGIKITPSELFTTAMLEGLSREAGIFQTDGYYENHYVPVSGWNDLGTDTLGDPEETQRLKSGGFIPSDLNVISRGTTYNEKGLEVNPGDFDNLGDGLKAVAGVLAQRKYAFVNDFKNFYGEEEFAKMSEDEKFFWTSVYYNGGEGLGKRQLTTGIGRDFFSSLEEEKEASDVFSLKNNALIRMVTNKLHNELGIFNFF